MRASEFLTEYRDRLLQYVKSLLPTWPEYVLKDWLVPNKGDFSNLPDTELKNGIMEKLQGVGLTPDTKWQLVPDMKFTMDMFDPMTKQRLIGRAGGKSDLGMQIPRDAERHATQAALAQQQGGVRKEPVLLIKTANGYELLEGWHRTIQHFAQYPEGYTGPAYVAVAGAIQENFAEGADPDKKYTIKKSYTMSKAGVEKSVWYIMDGDFVVDATDLRRDARYYADKWNAAEKDSKGVAENFADGKNPGRKEIDPDVYEDLSNSIIARTARQIVPTIRAKSTPEGYVYLSTQDGLSLVIGCNIAGGSIDINIGSQPMETTSSGPHKGAVTKIISAVYQAAVKRYGTPTEQGTLSIDHDAGHGVWQHIAQKLGLQYDAHMVKENFANPAKAYRAHLIKTLPQIMKLFANIGKGWIPSKEQMLSAVDNAYQVMKHTGDAKQAGKVLMDELNTLYRMSKNKQDVAENFADGKNPGRKGLSKRVGIPKKATLGKLEKIAQSSTGERRRMAQWQLNMRRGKKK